MSPLRSWPSIAVLGCSLIGCPSWAQERPHVLPTRDVDITYDVTRPQEPKIRERRRWLAGERLERVDGHDKSSTIFDVDKGELTLLNPTARTFLKLEGAPRRPADPEKGAVLKRGDEAVVAGLHCTNWSWTEDVETRTACMTADGVLLRLVVDGYTVIEAHTVSYGPQKVELFRVPPDYAPALAPEGGTSD
jgi:hypothetical protein